MKFCFGRMPHLNLSVILIYDNHYFAQKHISKIGRSFFTNYMEFQKNGIVREIKVCLKMIRRMKLLEVGFPPRLQTWSRPRYFMTTSSHFAGN